ncbi:MAG: nicotinamide-nucleotide adenylyltransferase, partial [Candidatus Micrarchaeota archaeon]|nr:nicotinamide-nucleotide adenylyltransferase [Candidatus Micrarchaeota archaeon]
MAKYSYGCGLFIGRFQPFHKGHLYALKYALRLSKKVIIGIGSAEEYGTSRNPLTSNSRIKIIKSAFKEQEIDMKRIGFFEIPDFNDNDAWFDFIMHKSPKVQVVFSRNSLVRRIFRSRGVPVVSPPWHKRQKLSATKVRKLIRAGRKWQDKVPSGSV